MGVHGVLGLCVGAAMQGAATQSLKIQLRCCFLWETFLTL